MANTPPDDRSKRFLFEGSDLNRMQRDDSRRHLGYNVLPNESSGRSSTRQTSHRPTQRRQTEYEPTPGLFSGGRSRQSGSTGRYIGVALMAGAAALLVVWLFLSIGQPDGTVVGGAIPVLDGAAAGEPGGDVATFASPDDSENTAASESGGVVAGSRGESGVSVAGAAGVAGSVGENPVAGAVEGATEAGADGVGLDGERARLTVEVFSRPPAGKAARDTTPAGSF